MKNNYTFSLKSIWLFGVACLFLPFHLFAQPTAVCQNSTVYLDATGVVTVNPALIDGGSTNFVSLEINGQPSFSYTCTDLGVNNATLLATDALNNTASCVATITVVDTIAPVATCQNITAQLDSSGLVTIMPSQINNGSFDNCSVFTYLLNAQPSITYNCSNVGLNMVTLSVTDQSGNMNSCMATVTIQDNIAPMLSCQNTTAILDQNGNATVYPITLLGNPLPTDACGPLTYTINGNLSISYNCTNVGSNFVILEATDANGNSSNCSATITVLDTTSPTINCTPYTLYLDNSGNGSISFVNIIDLPNTHDNCSIFLYTVNGSTSGNFFTCANIGPNIMTVVAQDPSGNIGTCLSTVTVVDTIAPVVNCNPFTINLTATGAYTLTLADLGVFVSDACAVDTIIITPNVIDCSMVGVVPISVIAIDTNGNSTTCISNVTVLLDGPMPTSNSSQVYEGQSIVLFANPPATGFTYSYLWSSSIGYVDTVANPVILNAQLSNSGMYCVTITANGFPGGCVAFNCVSVTVLPNQNMVTTNPSSCDTSICDGDATIILGNGISNYTAVWNDGLTQNISSDTIFRNAMCYGQYSVVITDNISLQVDTIDLLISPEAGCVWPGDADDNTFVNNMDLLPISLAYGESGPVRPNATTGWYSQGAPLWSPVAPVAGLPNYRHIDCNGDGIINQLDQNAITQNYGFNYYRSQSSLPGTIPFYVMEDTVLEGARLSLPIILGSGSDPVTDGYGVAFTINYDPALVGAGSVNIDMLGSWLGTDLMSVQKDFSTSGRIEAAIARKDRLAVNGFGAIGNINLTIRDDIFRIPGTRDLIFTVSNVRLIDNLNNEIGTDPQNTTTTIELISGIEVSNNDFRVAVLPNPAQELLNVRTDNAELESIQLYTTTGQLVYQANALNGTLHSINLNDMPQGMYILQVATDKGLQNHKVVVRK